MSSFSGKEFAVLLWVLDITVTMEEQAKLSEQLVEQGCRYAVCAGYRCSTWDDSIDLAYLQTESNFQPQNENFVMTTWHENESIEEIAEFFVMNTAFDNFTAKNLLILVIGKNQEMESRIVETVKNLLCIEAS